MKKISNAFLVGLLSGVITLGAYKLFFEPQAVVVQDAAQPAPMINANFKGAAALSDNMNFIHAANQTVNAVVHVKNLSISKGPSSIMDFFYGYGGTPRAQVGTGSGVIISPDGHIVTNNHVIANASELEVTLNDNKRYKATLVGTDEETDIALLKVDAEEELPYLAFGDSDNTQVGEWVLAVGNPFNLTSTVTAGIISAKARDLDQYDGQFQSFIQTDAAVNPGNSGGALVNINGELIGINTAITSQTGSYVGYSFAVPSNIARKVVEDLMEYGNVQTGILGINGSDLSNIDPESLNTRETQGIYIANVIEDSGADRAGIKEGDILKEVDRIKINKFSDLTGYLRSKRPDDRVVLHILRDGKPMEIPVTLLKDNSVTIALLNMSVRNQSSEDKKRFRNARGVKIINSMRYTGNQTLNGRLLIAINDDAIEDVDDINPAIERAKRNGYLSIVTMDESGEKERLIFRN